MYKITILIPIYNGIEYLKECLDSVKLQSYTDWLVLIGVNGHPHDSDTYKIAKESESDKIKIKQYLNTNGKAEAMMKMKDDVKTPYICILDVDDKWHPEKLSEQSKFIDIYDVIGTQCQYFGYGSGYPTIPLKDSINNHNFFDYNPVINSSVLMRTDLLLYSTKGELAKLETVCPEDYSLWLKLWKMGKKFYNVDQVLVYHRIHSDSWFNNRPEQYLSTLKKYYMDKTSEITVVTSYYEIRSKFSNKQYWKWIENFCIIPCHLVIFTSADLVEKFKILRSDFIGKTTVISLKFEDLYHYQYIEKYREYYNRDYNKSHSPDLYVIWAEKVKFIMRAIQLNPFKSSKFVWCDIGCVREEKFINTLTYFPVAEKITGNKMNFLLLKKFTEQEYKNAESGILGQQYGQIRFGGGIQGADIETWEKYNNLWDLMLQKYFKADRFAGQDQCIIGSIYLENPDLFYAITVSKDYIDNEWFYLLHYWS